MQPLFVVYLLGALIAAGAIVAVSVYLWLVDDTQFKDGEDYVMMTLLCLISLPWIWPGLPLVIPAALLAKRTKAKNKRK